MSFCSKVATLLAVAEITTGYPSATSREKVSRASISFDAKNDTIGVVRTENDFLIKNCQTNQNAVLM